MTRSLSEKRPVQCVVERRMQFFQRETGKKAQAAHIDGQDGNPARGGQAGGGEHGAVAAKHEKKLRSVSYALARLALRAVRQAVGCLLVNESRTPRASSHFSKGGTTAARCERRGREMMPMV